MAFLSDLQRGGQRLLRADHLIGRVAPCDLAMSDEPLVSRTHASLRWNVSSWELKDLGSGNGTWINGRRVGPHWMPVRDGDVLAFGRPANQWRLSGGDGPVVWAGSDVGEIAAQGDLLALPDFDQPSGVLTPSLTGAWVLDADGVLPRTVADGEKFLLGGRTWTLHVPTISERTIRPGVEWSLHAAQVEFRVSRDEEHVEVSVNWPGRTLELGAKAHHYLLLVLARQRLADAALPHAEAGWIDQELVRHMLRKTANALHLEVHRARRAFLDDGVTDGGAIVERRAGSHQMRCGAENLSIHSL